MRLGARRVLGALAVVLALSVIAFATLRSMPSEEVRLPLLCLICGDLGGVDAILNLFLFVPLGAALVVAGWPVRRAAVAAFLVTFAVESLQFAVITGRDASLGDLTTNTAGGTLGAAMAAAWRGWVLPQRHVARRLAAGAAMAVLFVLAATAAALRPSVPPPPYFGQFAPVRLTLVPFDGTVHSFLVGGVQVPYGEVEDGDALHEALLGGEHWGRAEVTTRSSPGARSDIVRVGSRPQSIMAISRRHHDMLFRARVRAADWALRTPIVVLRGAFPTPAGRYTLEGALDTRGWHLEARGARGVHSRDIPFSALLGWSFLLPFEFTLDERLHLLNALWAAVLMIPVVYWSAWAARGGGAHWWLLPLAMTVAVSLVVPLMAGFPLAHPLEIAGALVGFGVGAALARLGMGHREARRAPAEERA